MNQRVPPKSPYKPPVGSAAPPSHLKRWLLLGGVVIVVIMGGAIGGSLLAASIARGKLELIAKEAGLQLVLDGLTVSPLGQVHVTGLALQRADKTNVVAVKDARAWISPWKALFGRRRPEKADVTGFALDARVEDGKPRELLDLYKAARKVFPRKEKTEDSGEKHSGSMAFTLAEGAVSVSVKGKGAEYLPGGLRAKDIAAHVDLGNGVGDLAATFEGTVQSKLAAKLVAQPSGPPRLDAKFAPEFRLAMPAGKALPFGIDSVSVLGLGFDADDGGAVEDIVFRHGTDEVVRVGRLRPDRGGLGVRAEKIAFTLPAHVAKEGDDPAKPTPKGKKGEKSDKGDAAPKAEGDVKPGAPALPAPPTDAPPAAEPAKGAHVWSGTIEAVALDLATGGAGDMALAARLEKLVATMPGGVATLGVEKVELKTDRMPGEQPLEALVELKVTGPSMDLPWREDALQQIPGGKTLWAAVTAAEKAKLREQIEDDVAEEIDDPSLPPEVKKKKQAEKLAQKLKAAGVEDPAQAGKKPDAKKGEKGPSAASKSAVTQYVKPVKDLHAKLLGADALVQRLIDKLSQAPRLKVMVEGGRLGLVRAGAPKPFGGIQDAAVETTALMADGSRALKLTARPFDDERPWGQMGADIVIGAGGKLQKAHFAVAGSEFAQALRVVSSNVTVKPDSDFELKLDVTLGATPGQSLTVTGDFLVRKIGFDWWRLAPRPIDELSASGKMELKASSDGTLRLEFPDLQVGQAKVNALLEATSVTDKPVIHAKVEMPKQDCGSVAKSIPPAMLATIGHLEAKGEMSLLLDLTVPLTNVYKSDLKLEFDDSQCEVTSFGNVDVTELAGEFSRPVNENGVLLDDVQVGPTSGAWVALADLHPWTPWAMIATEDGRFYKHRGIAPGLVLRAIRLDLDYGRFVYGGSTITQQLVKNIFLTRAKNLSRKFEELLIVWQMERKLPNAKDRILELYINFIEFGPKIYGVQRAAQTYFGKDAKDLSPLESAFLAANKPCPRCGYARFAGKKWDSWWQERMTGVMTKMRDEGIITDEQFIAEAPYIPHFVGWPQSKLPLVAPEGGAPEAGGKPVGGTEE